MYLHLSKELLPYFSSSNLFDTLMQLRGKVFRELEGRCTQRITVNNNYYFLKSHRGIGWKEIFKNIFQGRLPIFSAKNEWRALERLHAIGIPAPHVVGIGFRGWNPAQMESFLITRELPCQTSLEDLTKNWHNTPPEPAYKRKLIDNVARVAKRLHENGINHRDFYICHFLIDNKDTLYLIDLHRAQIRQTVPSRWLIKDLAGLYFSSKDIGLTSRDILRFIKIYRGLSLRSIINKESAFWQKVRKRGDKLYQKHSKRD